MKIGYLGWLGFRNFGDELCFWVFKKRFPQHKWVPWPKNERVDFVLIGGGTLLHFRRESFMQLMERLLASNAPPFGIWGTGVEPLDHGGIQNVPKSLMAPADIPLLKAVLDKARFVGVRGPISQRLIEPYKAVDIVGDPGLLSDPVPARKRDVLIFSFGKAAGVLFGSDENAVYAAFSSLINRACGKRHRVVIVPAWIEDVPICQRVAKSLSGKVKVRFPRSVKGYLKALSAARAVVAMKLHIAIAAASQGTPFVQAAYRTKCLDFAQSIGAEAAVVRTDALELAHDLGERLEECLRCGGAWNRDKVEQLRTRFLRLKEYL